MNWWQPVNSAPGDEPVLLFCPDAREPKIVIGILSTFVDGEGSAVCTEWGDFWTDRELDVEPSHWAPLPNKPEPA